MRYYSKDIFRQTNRLMKSTWRDLAIELGDSGYTLLRHVRAEEPNPLMPLMFKVFHRTGLMFAGTTTMVELRRKLAAERTRKDLTLEQLAKKAGRCRWTVHRVLSGQQTPTLNTVLAICAPLGVVARIEVAPPRR